VLACFDAAQWHQRKLKFGGTKWLKVPKWVGCGNGFSLPTGEGVWGKFFVCDLEMAYFGEF